MKSHLSCFVSLILVGWGSAYGHHSGAMYDMTRIIAIEGTVSRYEWANPHVYVFVAQEGLAGNEVEWEIEMQPPSVMRRIGWPQDTIAIGDQLSVSGHPAKRIERYALNPISIERNGTTLYDQVQSTTRLSTANTDHLQRATDLEGTWETLLSLDEIMRFVIPNLELTEKGADALESYIDAEMNPGTDCIANSAPLFMINPDVKRIRIQEDHMTIAGSTAGEVREIHFGPMARENLAESNQGHSIGRWEDGTLVIETSQFARHRMGNAYAGVPSGPEKRLTEHLNLGDDRLSLTYSFELTDPEFLAAPVTGQVVWSYRPDAEFVLEVCQLENARRFLED